MKSEKFDQFTKTQVFTDHITSAPLIALVTFWLLMSGLVIFSVVSSKGNLLGVLLFELGMTVVFGALAFGLIWFGREQVLNQCLVIVEEYNLQLTSKQRTSISSHLFPGAIFKDFVSIVEEVRLELLSPTLLSLAKKKRTAKACQKFVEDLWRRAPNYHPPLVATPL